MNALKELDAIARTIAGKSPKVIDSFKDTIVEKFPYVALREFFINALVHRSYESTSPVRITVYQDRIEVQSPGGLFGESSPSNFPWTTSYRNPLIASACKVLGLVNRFGRGVVMAQEALVANGSKEATFDFQPESVKCVVWARVESKA